MIARAFGLLLLMLTPTATMAATRLYLPSVATAEVSPPFTHESTWDEVDNADRREMHTVKVSSAMTSRTEAKATGANVRQLVRQYVSRRLDGAQLIAAVAVKGTVRVLESAINDNLDKVSMKLIVTSEDGQTLRCTLLVKGDYGPTNEFDTVLENRRIADGDVMTLCNASNLDRVVAELGFNNTTTGTSITGTMNFGDDNASDCLDDETTQSACNPFIELATDLVFLGPVATCPTTRASMGVGC
ncbi:MAG: hypothetical protein ACRDGM_04625 [bacterium]